MHRGNKVIFLSFVEKPGYFESRFYVADLERHGLAMEYWDLSALFGNGSMERHHDAPARVRKFARRSGLVEGVEAERSASFVLLMGLEYRFLWLYRLLAKYGCRLFFFSWGAFPIQKQEKGPSVLGKIPSPARVYRGVVLRAFRLFGLLKGFDIVFYAGAKAKSSAPMAKRYVPVNLPDVEEYCDLASQGPAETGQDEYVLFIDSYLPFHPDFSALGLKPIDPEKYRLGMNGFLDRVERRLGKAVVIAAHPKSDYPHGYFGDRALIKNRTAELVMNASAVISHYSTSTSYAVLWRKPIIFVYSEEMKDHKGAEYMVPITMAMAEALSMPVYNIDEPPEEIALPEVQDKYYERYRLNYITTNAPPCNQRNMDVFIRTFSSHD